MNVEDYRNRFDRYLALVAFLQTVVLEETLMIGLSPWIKMEVETVEPIGLAQMMKFALKIENKELVRKECGLSSAFHVKLQLTLSIVENNNTMMTKEETSNGKSADESYHPERSYW